MEIIEKIHLIIDDLDEGWLVSIVRTCSDMATRFRLDLTFCEKDQTKLEFIQSKRQEVQEKIKEMGMKAHYAVDLYNQHLDIELKKVSNGQAFNIPLMLNTTSIFKEKIERILDSEDEYNEVDHVECALTNAQKAGEEFIVWTIFYSELEDLLEEINESMIVDQKDELHENAIKETSVKKEPLEIENSQYIHDWQRIFKDLKAFKIFEYLQDNLVTEKNQLADYTFIFRQMQRDEYIYDDIKEKVFRDFLGRNFDIEIDYKLKPEGYNITDSKEKMYSNAIRSSW